MRRERRRKGRGGVGVGVGEGQEKRIVEDRRKMKRIPGWIIEFLTDKKIEFEGFLRFRKGFIFLPSLLSFLG